MKAMPTRTELPSSSPTIIIVSEKRHELNIIPIFVINNYCSSIYFIVDSISAVTKVFIIG